jgi:ABC-type multidrug transport system fused ATPase/permease subunit
LSRIGKEQVAANVMKYKTATEALSGIKDLKIMGRERHLLERFAIQAQHYAHNNVIHGTIAQLPRYALEVMALGGVLLMVLYYLGVKGESPSQTIPFLALYVYAGYRLLPALQQIFANLTTVRYNLAALDLLCRDLHEGGGAVDGEAVLQHSAAAEPLPFSRECELRDLQFSYGGNQTPAIRGISLTIARNASIGLVGATGSGKSTLVDIIIGLLCPDSGQLLVDGAIVDGEMLVSWQRNFGYVPQHIYLTDDTVTRNIAFGVPDAEIDLAAVIRAARIANLHEFIEQQLPKGYDTVIGERGVRLSGGQRQRIGIARALYHDPAILIMDEATNALDGVTEEAVMEALGRLAGQKTIIMIAHRLTTVKECDLVYILERGQIVSQGTYEELQQSSEWFQAASR